MQKLVNTIMTVVVVAVAAVVVSGLFWVVVKILTAL